jgi:nucleoside-diphosphate-sugar epimerase
MTRFLAHQLSSAHWFNIADARRDLGYEPLVSIDEGLRRLSESLRGPAPTTADEPPRVADAPPPC